MISILRIGNSNARRYILNLVSLIPILFSQPLLANERCVATGQWTDPATLQSVEEQTVLAKMKDNPIILLGEHHQNPYHHAWHLDQLQLMKENLSDFEIALEMLPVKSQPVIDQWLRDEISDEVFIDKSGWNTYWNHDVNLYLPMLKFAKENRIPLHAINISKQLFKDVSMNGWDAIPEGKREGVTTPGAATRAYLVQLARSFRRHGTPSGKGVTEEEGARFKRFTEVQLLWDRAMAEGISRVRLQAHAPVVVAIMGSGHMMHGFGTPQQLKDKGLAKFLILVPWDDHLDCEEIKPGFADVIYGSPYSLD